MKFAFFAAAAFLSASSALAARCYGSGNFTKTQFPNCKELSPTFAAHWSVADGTVTLGLNADVAEGNWFAFGISENGGMNGADIVALIKKDGKWSANDLFTSTYALPVADKSQDWKLVQEPIYAADKTASAILSRKLRTCDDSDHEIKVGMEYPIIWAIGTSPDLKIHSTSNRGNSMINFQKTAFQLSEEKKLAEADRSSYKILDLRIPEITMPKKLTTYMCVNFELPSDQKYHVVEYEALVPKNDYTLHHIQVNQCTSKPKNLNTAYECNSAGFEAGCQTMVIIWGPGVEKVAYPSAAGLPIGKGVTQWLNFQFHYNNADGVSNYKDNSGIRLVYTSKLRPNDIGIAVLGPTNLNLPKGRAEVESPKSVCKYASGPDVTLINNEFHMHSRGKKMNTFHVRSGKELAPLGDRSYYDYRFQSTSLIPEESSIVKAGDQLITFCTFDTSQMTYDLRWGEGSDQEMCFQFIQYYPRSASMCSGGGGSATFTKYEAPKCVPS